MFRDHSLGNSTTQRSMELLGTEAVFLLTVQWRRWYFHDALIAHGLFHTTSVAALQDQPRLLREKRNLPWTEGHGQKERP